MKKTDSGHAGRRKDMKGVGGDGLTSKRDFQEKGKKKVP